MPSSTSLESYCASEHPGSARSPSSWRGARRPGFERAQQAEWQRLLGLRTGVLGDPAWSDAEATRLVHCLPATGADLDTLLGQLGLRFA